MNSDDIRKYLEQISKLASKEKEEIEQEKPLESSRELEESEKDDLDKAAKRENIEDQKQDRGLRKEYVNKIFVLLVVWLGLVIAILVFDGFSITIFCHQFNLSDTILITLITTTTANIAVLFYVVTKHLFPKGKD